MKNPLILFTLVVLSACKQNYVENPNTLSPGKSAKIVSLAPSDDPLPILVSGKVQPSENMKLSFKTGGIVQKLYVQEGQFIQKGQVLGQLNLAEISAQVTQAQVNVEKLKRDLTRFQRLYTDSAATLQSVQDIETGLKIAESDLSVAKFNQTHSQIIAPTSGRILQRMAEENELVNPGQPIYTISTQLGGMSLKVGMADRDVVKVRLGDSARVTFDAYPGMETTAAVTEIAAEGHPLTGTYAVEIAIVDFPYELKSGFFAKAEIFPENQSPYYKIPLRAMVEGLEDQVAIFIPENDKAKRMVVTPQYIGETYFTVNLADLDHSLSSVITEGAAYLREGESFTALN